MAILQLVQLGAALHLSVNTACTGTCTLQTKCTYLDLAEWLWASDCQCRSRNSPGLDPSILRHSGIWGVADEAVMKKAHKKSKKSPSFFLQYIFRYIKHIYTSLIKYTVIYTWQNFHKLLISIQYNDDYIPSIFFRIFPVALNIKTLRLFFLNLHILTLRKLSLSLIQWLTNIIYTCM